MKLKKFNPNLSTRATMVYASLCCLGLMIIALVMQYAFNLKPCPLCVLQRLIFVILFILFSLAALPRPKKTLLLIYNSVILLTSSFGMLVAGRQVWLQHLPADQIPTCGPGISYMLQHLPLWDVLRLLFEGSGDCARVDWSWLGLSIAGWSFLFFLSFVMLAVVTLFRLRKQ